MHWNAGAVFQVSSLVAAADGKQAVAEAFTLSKHDMLAPVWHVLAVFFCATDEVQAWKLAITRKCNTVDM